MKNWKQGAFIGFLAIIVLAFTLTACDFLNGNNGNDNGNGNESEKNVNKIIDKILSEFYEEHQLLGGISVAISRNGKLVYRGAVGYADINHTVKLTPEHRMRIASVSKPITHIVILKLQEEGILNVDDFVFGNNTIFNNKYGMPVYDGNPVDITIQQLINHRGGGWGASTDWRGISIRELKQRIENIPLEHLPGTTYEYSNFGYWILGRVIEEITGITYENYIKETFLDPIGIDGMRIGRTVSASDEVEYIATPGATGSQSNPATFNNPVNMDSFGGWIANPVELAKILVHWGGLISNNWSHSGSIPGAYSWVQKRSDGFTYAMTANYRPPDPRYTWSPLFAKIQAAVSEWPTGSEL